MATKKSGGEKRVAGKKAAKKKAAATNVAATAKAPPRRGPDGFLGKWRLFAFKLRQADRELLSKAAEEDHVDDSVFVRKALFAELNRRGHKPSGDY